MLKKIIPDNFSYVSLRVEIIIYAIDYFMKIYSEKILI